MENEHSGTKFIEIESPQKKVGFFELFITLLILLLVFSGIGFGVGLLIGKVEANQPEIAASKQKAVVTDKKDGSSRYFDPNNKYEVIFPSVWKSFAKEQGVDGVLFETDGASVELWLTVDQKLGLNEEQKASLAKTEEIDLTINKQKIKATKYSYKVGSFLTTATLPSNGQQPKVTVWIKAQDIELYATATTIVESFQFKK